MGQQDLKVQELVDKIGRREIRLPEMQRQYVWGKTRVRDLLDSLYRGYPSGTILTWETDEQVATRDFAVSQQNAGYDRFQLLLDGQQRLTSLSALLRGEPMRVRDRKRPIDILFNLDHPDKLEEITEVFDDEQVEDVDQPAESEADNDDSDDIADSDSDENTVDANTDEILDRFNRMAFVVHSNKLASLPQWVSVSDVFRTDSDRPFLEKAGVVSMDDERFDKYSKRLQKLREIKDYEYRVHILDRDKSYEEVTEIFVRVNSRGVKLRSSDLALAQITAKWPGSLAIFQDFENARVKEGFDLGLAIHLKNLVAFATNQSRFNSVGSIPKAKLETSWEASKKGMEYALNFLRSNMLIDSPALLSSPFLIITIAKYGDLKKYRLTSGEEAALRHWALVANAKARYSRGSTESFLDQDLATLRDDKGIEGLVQSLKAQVGRLDIFPEDLINRNSRSAYFKTMFVIFRKNDARDWRDQLVISLKHLGVKHSLQFHHIFPRKVLERAGKSKQQINDICNFAFISGGTNRAISDTEPAVYLPELLKNMNPDELSKQCIPDAQRLWKVEAYEDFLSARRELVARKLNEFLQS